MNKDVSADVLTNATPEHEEGITGCFETLKIYHIPEEGLLFEGVLLRCIKPQSQRDSTVTLRV
jgi:hypothetical protein